MTETSHHPDRETRDIKLIQATPARIEAVIGERDAAVLRLLAEHTIPKTAELTGLSESTIKVIRRVRRGRPSAQTGE
jgi:hypothetical protein